MELLGEFNDKEHHQRLEEWQIETLPDLAEEASDYNGIVAKILHWVNPLDTSQPNEYISFYEGRKDPIECIQELREKTKKIAKYLE